VWRKLNPGRQALLVLPTCAKASDGARVPRFRGGVSVWWCGVSVLLGGVQQGEGVAEALVEDLVGEFPVG
jgi:hypothetical protein